ncbi:unnamed protein product [Caenorhabditis brenneri]
MEPNASIDISSLLLQQAIRTAMRIPTQLSNPNATNTFLNNMLLQTNPITGPNTIPRSLLISHGLPVFTNPTSALLPTPVFHLPQSTLNEPNAVTQPSVISQRELAFATTTRFSENDTKITKKSKKNRRKIERKYDKDITEVKEGYICKYCQKVYETYKKASDHIVRYHLRSQLKCHFCGYKSAISSPFHSHMYVHHGIPIPENSSVYKKRCPECLYVAKNELFLKNHIARKHNTDNSALELDDTQQSSSNDILEPTIDGTGMNSIQLPLLLPGF